MYTAEQIARCQDTPLENVQATWPEVVAALRWQGIFDHYTQIAMIATIVVETGITLSNRVMTFLPITEIDGQFARYAPYYGRGLIQCTWRENYAAYGPRLLPPHDLVTNPDILLQTKPSAQMAALYFRDHGIQTMANRQDWEAVRVAVNGGLNGWPVFIAAVQVMLDQGESPGVPTVGVPTILRQTPQSNGKHALDGQRREVLLPVGQVVHFAPNPSPGRWQGLTTTPHWAHVLVDGGPVHGWLQRANLVSP